MSSDNTTKTCISFSMSSTPELIRQFESMQPASKRVAIEEYFQSPDENVLIDSLEILSHFFADTDKGVRDIVAQILLGASVQHGVAQKSLSIVSLITHSRIEVRNLAADTLVKLGEGIGGSIAPYLTHEDPEVRKMSCEIITAIGSPILATNVLPLLDEQDENVLCAAIETIGALRVVSSVPKLLHLFYQHEIASPYILDALGKISTKEAEDFIIEQIRSDNNFIQVAAINALAECSSSASLAIKLVAIIEIAPEELQPLLLHTIYAISMRSGSSIAPPQSLRTLYMRMMTSDNQEYRIAGIWAMQHDLTTAETHTLCAMYLLADESERILIFTLVAQSSDALLIDTWIKEILEKSTDYDLVESLLQNLQESWQEISQFAGVQIQQTLHAYRMNLSEEHLERVEQLFVPL
jgi:hypothetical protein